MKEHKRNIWIVLCVTAVFLYAAIFGLGSDFKGAVDMRFGIDIRGGVEAVFEPEGVTETPSAEDLDAARTVIENRLDAQNILDREVTADKEHGNIIVRFPWKSDEKTFNPEAAIAELGETAKLTFRDSQGNVLVEGKNVADSSVVKNKQTGEYEVSLEFDKQGAEDFADATEKLVGQSMGIYMDEEQISNPVVREAIKGGQAVINGMGSQEEAETLSEKINAGALPFSLKTTNYNTISPTLGSGALKAMTTAAATAFILVCIFMILYYRLPGMIACLALVFQMSLQVLALSVPQYTLTLPGIAGLILSLGMAVDANVIISERIGEELQKGSSIRTAVRRGYKNAFSSVLDGNVTTAAVAVILMIFGSGTMLSFGYTLLTGVLINLAAGVWLSRVMLSSVILYPGFQKLKLFRVKKERKVIDFLGKRKAILIFTVSVLVAGSIISAVRGVTLDTQFTGGVILKYTCEGTPDTEKAAKAVEGVLDRPVSAQAGEDFVSGQEKLVLNLGGNQGISPQEQEKVLQQLQAVQPELNYQSSETYAVEPYIGARALKNSAIAIVLAALFIVVYIRLRFSALSGFSAGVSGVIALLHDVFIVFLVFGVCKIPLNDAFASVTLTIIGYSINDTIVLYDRIREHMSGHTKEGLVPLVNRSITETLGRSVNTAFTTVLCVAIVLVFAIFYNIESIKIFALPMLIGMISGCYSSICVAGAIWVTWKERKKS
ncbi:protein translocase subunit SecD [Eubacterium sp. am_0171]|uniref:protein translocase subunit SecD n=1 Tax=unclassified Eubacterium (in: firmicutes) TaxID=2624479 RepID=UPI00101FF29E|nr:MULTISPECIES: protein translocase subunit SecD [unclassified Eubacterium (in: firmicutes)]MSC84801.1 protein translocase subunit SecD [Eubacterium sp. BIOML-A1]MSD06866.1 protein translocase subunit SecD [Eubacterium sp. BIOML-A2]RYT17631.1 protein translocase subunit SecD [Eubacterium sp. am_0171]